MIWTKKKQAAGETVQADQPLSFGMCAGFREQCLSSRRWVFTTLWGVVLLLVIAIVKFAFATSAITTEVKSKNEAQDARIKGVEEESKGANAKLDVLIQGQRALIEELRKK
jgi:hypothetical protein